MFALMHIHIASQSHGFMIIILFRNSVNLKTGAGAHFVSAMWYIKK